jgi:hypothetical protein
MRFDRMFASRRRVVVLSTIYLYGCVAAYGAGACQEFGVIGLGERKALIIGNSDYNVLDDLPSSKQDAIAISERLEKFGYAGYRCIDLKDGELSDVVSNLLDSRSAFLLPGEDFLFYYSGHGTYNDGQDYLFGINAQSLSWKAANFSLQKLRNFLDDRTVGTNVVIVDACRATSSVNKGGTKTAPGFSQQTVPSGSYYAFAAEPRTMAKGAKKGLSVFTEALVAEIDANAEVDIDLLFRHVRERLRRSKTAQKPWTQHTLTGELSLQKGYATYEGSSEAEKRQRELERTQLCGSLEKVKARVKSGDRLGDLFFASDVLRLRICESGDTELALKVSDALADGSYEAHVSTAKEVRNALGELSESNIDACTSWESSVDCQVEMIGKAGKFKGVSGKGKLWFLPLHWGKKGHYEITQQAALAGGFTPAAARVLADASQDADIYEWTNPAAHGQTPMDRNGAFLDVAKAQNAFREWRAASMKRVGAACTDPRTALYWLGYTLHGVQDVVFHRGISNAEHSYLDGSGKGVDTVEDYDAKIALATEASKRFLEAAGKQVPCWSGLLAEATGSWLSGDEKAKLGLTRDLTFKQIRQYRLLANLIESALAIEPENRAKYFLPDERWFKLDERDRLWQLLELQ